MKYRANKYGVKVYYPGKGFKILGENMGRIAAQELLRSSIGPRGALSGFVFQDR